MSMVKELLSAEKCGRCRVCCGFTREDIWEIPLIFSENRKAVEEKLGVELIERGGEFVFDMDFGGNEIAYCPALSENGCVLGELKPFDCAVWPFRVNSLGSKRVITVSPVCEEVFSLPLKRLSEFVYKGGFAQRLFAEAERHPDMVKPYTDGYPILAVENAKNRAGT